VSGGEASPFDSSSRQRAAGSGQHKVEVAAKKRKEVTINQRCDSMSYGKVGQLPCDVIAAGSRQHKVEVAAKKEKR